MTILSFRFPVGLMLSLSLGGCAHSVVSVNTSSGSVRSAGPGTSVTQTSVRASSDTRLGVAIIIGVLLADGLIRYFREEPDGRRTPVDEQTARQLGVSRQIDERSRPQDCSGPIEASSGHLMCR